MQLLYINKLAGIICSTSKHWSSVALSWAIMFSKTGLQLPALTGKTYVTLVAKCKLALPGPALVTTMQ